MVHQVEHEKTRTETEREATEKSYNTAGDRDVRPVLAKERKLVDDSSDDCFPGGAIEERERRHSMKKNKKEKRGATSS